VSAILNSPSPPEALAIELLPDLAAQVQEFIALPPPSPAPRETLFLVSFGFWDTYNFAGLDYALGKNLTDKAVNELFDQLNILYSHYSRNLSGAHATAKLNDAPTITPGREEPAQTHPPFRVIIPKLFDPTLVPGWIDQRPIPLRPSSVAEHQKNAVYLTSRWNTLVENRITGWLKSEPRLAANDIKAATANLSPLPFVEKYVFYYDLAQHLLDIIIEHQLGDEGLSDASGLGTGENTFESVYEPCVREAYEGHDDEFVESNGLMVCKEPEEYLFWDSFNLGVVANERIGKEVGAMVMEGKSMSRIWDQKGDTS
jgi:hypothetical protein